MNESTDISTGATNDQAFTRRAFTPRAVDKRYWAVAALIVMGCGYLDVGTRWQLAGTWNCEQEDGAHTVEQYGFFGQQSSYAVDGRYGGTTMEGRFGLKDRVFSLTLSRVERADGQRLELSTLRSGIIGAQGEIKTLANGVLEYEARANGNIAMVSCKRR